MHCTFPSASLRRLHLRNLHSVASFFFSLPLSFVRPVSKDSTSLAAPRRPRCLSRSSWSPLFVFSNDDREQTLSLSLSCPRVSERERCQLSSCSPNRKGKTTYCTFDERTVPSDACIRVQLARTIQHASNVASRVPTFNPFWALQ